MIPRTIALSRFLLAMALASLALALLPPALAARENSATVGWNAGLFTPAAGRSQSLETSNVAKYSSASALAHLAGPIAAQPPLTEQLSLKLHPTLLKQWLNGTSEQIPVLIQLRAQADLKRSAVASAPSVVA